MLFVFDSAFYVYIFFFAFSEEKYVEDKKKFVQDLIPSSNISVDSIYKCVCVALFLLTQG